MARSLLPREHGAHAQLGLPLLAALVSGRPGAAAALLALSATGAFLAHEPARVVLGHRGSRAQREDGQRARLRVLAIAVPSAVFACLALVLAPATRVPALLVLPFLLVAGWLASRDADRTLVGETIAGAALPGMAMPVAVASGVAPSEAIAAWCAWSFCFALSTAAVRALTARSAVERRRMPWLVACLAACGAIAIGWGFTVVVAAVPVALVAVAVLILRPQPRYMRRVGWSFAAAVIATAAAVSAHARIYT